MYLSVKVLHKIKDQFTKRSSKGKTIQKLKTIYTEKMQI